MLLTKRWVNWKVVVLFVEKLSFFGNWFGCCSARLPKSHKLNDWNWIRMSSLHVKLPLVAWNFHWIVFLTIYRIANQMIMRVYIKLNIAINIEIYWVQLIWFKWLLYDFSVRICRWYFWSKIVDRVYGLSCNWFITVQCSKAIIIITINDMLVYSEMDFYPHFNFNPLFCVHYYFSYMARTHHMLTRSNVQVAKNPHKNNSIQ